VVVAAAGNEGPHYQTISSPSDAHGVISVGNTFKNDHIEEWGSRGPTNVYYKVKPDLVAPGSEIYSTMPNGGYAHQSGTSMAAPIVAGAAALLLEHHPQLNPANINSILLQTAVDLGYNIWTQGAGRLDILEAFNIPDLIIDPAIISFGLVTPEINSWNRSTSMTIKNSTSYQQDVHVSLPENIPEGLTITCVPGDFLLAPGQEQQVEVSVIVDNEVLPFLNNFPEAYKQFIVFRSQSYDYAVSNYIS
jgi:hypothetical protein